MRYHDKGFTHHHNDTTYLDNMRRNLSLWLSLAPKGSITFGTSQSAWRSYFADHLDRMRDANSTVSNLWIMIRAKNARNEDLKRQLDQAKRDGFVQELRANDWKAGTENVVRQRDNLKRQLDGVSTDLATITDERDALVRAWNGCNEIIDRRNATVKELKGQVDYWHGQFLDESSESDRQYGVIVDLKAKLAATSTFTDECNTRQAARIKVLEATQERLSADLDMVKKAAAVEAGKVDRALSVLRDPNRDAWAAACQALDALEGRNV